jgi:hypothetical protein
MSLRSVRFGVRSWKLSNVGHWMVTKNLLSLASPCFGKHVNTLVPAEFAVVSTQQPALGLRGALWLVILMSNMYIRKACAPAVGTLIG